MSGSGSVSGRRCRGSSSVTRDMGHMLDVAADARIRHVALHPNASIYVLRGDIVNLSQRARLLPPAGVVLEVGSFHGMSAMTMLIALRRRGNWAARVLSVDLWMDPDDAQSAAASDSSQQWYAFQPAWHRARHVDAYTGMVASSGAGHQAYMLRMHSVQAASFVPRGTVDLLFIDGDHSKAGAYADMAAWMPKVDRRTVMAGGAVDGGGRRDGPKPNELLMGGRVLLHDGSPSLHLRCGRGQERPCAGHVSEQIEAGQLSGTGE